DVTGCPIRSDISHLPDRDAAASRLSLDPRLNTLVVTGASQGAQTVNDAVIEMLGGVTVRGWQVLHLAGKDHAPAVRDGYRNLTERLKPTVESLRYDGEKRREMAGAARKLGKPNAAGNVASVLTSMI